MTSIGNDIIDLTAINITRTCQPRFYSKFLTPAERQLYNDQYLIPLHFFIWLLWSVKESAYKCLKRNQPGLMFSPIKIEVSHIARPSKTPVYIVNQLESTDFNDIECYQSIVVFHGATLYARSIVYGDKLLHSLAHHQESFEKISWGIKETGQTDAFCQSTAVRKFLSKRMDILFPEQIFEIRKDAMGIPTMINKKDKKTIPVSLSHHGAYVSYSLLKV